ncbi:MAG TPA: molybdenum cofactor biosynthesis protein MoaE [Rhodospirillaceae bacterium]|nr:molybdenum cofactor biosynthesis protein MoaE [Rhodospirillaceae bacterium]
MSVRVQAEDFDPGRELARLSAAEIGGGAVASFLGLVRGEGVRAMTLHHYPGMTERQLEIIEGQARSRWPLLEVAIIHRFGRLLPGDNIVFVGVAARHRGAAFAACEFLMDWLKTAAPFWKLEETADGEHWVEAKAEDDARTERWNRVKGPDER